jgi:uncharacterized protein
MQRRFSLLVVVLLFGDVAAQPTASPSRFARDIGLSFSFTIPLNGEHARFSRRALWEMGAVGLTGTGHLAFAAMDASALFIPIATVGWSGYIAYRAYREPGFFGRTGFTPQGLGPAFRDASLVAAGSLALMAGAGALQGSLTLHRDMVPLLLLYPAWGLIQQFLVQGMLAGNLSMGPGWTSSPYFVTPISAAAFGSVHVPNWRLAAGTFGLGLAYTPIYLRHRNLWPLGLYHGWLGVFYYFWVLEKNPWARVVMRE